MSEPRKQSGGRGQGGGKGQPAKGQAGRGQAGKSGQGGQGKRQQPRAGGPRRSEPVDTVQQLAGPLSNVLKRLPATQREVIEWRMGLKDGHPHDLADTARAMGISMSEARDIEKRAFEHIREVVPLDRLQKLLKG